MTRVVLDGRIILPRMTGAGRYVLELAARLPLLYDGLDLHVLLGSPLRNTAIARRLSLSRVHLHYCRAPVASALQWVEIPLVLRRLRPDVYHYPFLDMPYVGCPSVLTVYDLNPILFKDYFSGQRLFRVRFARALLQSSIHRCRMAIAISEATRVALESVCPEARGKTRVVYLATDPTHWSQPGEDSAELVEKRWQERPYVLYVGVDRPHKNLIRLVRAFAQFRAMRGWHAGSGAYLWLAGVGSGSEQLRDVIARERVEEDVRRTDALSEQRLVYVYRNARLLAYVSMSEGFGLPLLEAFAAGVPVVAADCRSLLEVGGDAAQYVISENEDAIAHGLETVWGDERVRQRLISLGTLRLAQYSWDQTARDTLQVYLEALSAGCERR